MKDVVDDRLPGAPCGIDSPRRCSASVLTVYRVAVAIGNSTPSLRKRAAVCQGSHVVRAVPRRCLQACRQSTIHSIEVWQYHVAPARDVSLQSGMHVLPGLVTKSPTQFWWPNPPPTQQLAAQAPSICRLPLYHGGRVSWSPYQHTQYVWLRSRCLIRAQIGHHSAIEL